MARPAPRISRDVPKPKPRPNLKLAPKHRAFVRSLGCLYANADCEGHIEAHHLKRLGGEGPAGVSGKHGDRWAIGLCHYGHHQFGPHSVHHHGDDEECLALAGFDGRAIAQFLWSHSGDEATCRAYLDKARDHARLKARGR